MASGRSVSSTGERLRLGIARRCSSRCGGEGRVDDKEFSASRSQRIALTFGSCDIASSSGFALSRATIAQSVEPAAPCVTCTMLRRRGLDMSRLTPPKEHDNRRRLRVSLCGCPSPPLGLSASPRDHAVRVCLPRCTDHYASTIAWPEIFRARSLDKKATTSATDSRSTYRVVSPMLLRFAAVRTAVGTTALARTP